MNLWKDTMPALRWWLLCHGIQAPTSLKKPKLIERIREAKKIGTAVVDVDGSYLFRKYEQCGHTNVPLAPNPPLAGWDLVSEENYRDIAKKIPKVTHGLLYTYLAEGTGTTENKGGAFRALHSGFVHWSSGRLQHLEVNCRNPMYCHIRCQMAPSMKPGIYTVYILLARDGTFASIQTASCQCAAGKSRSCTHVSGLLHALVAMCSSGFQASTSTSSTGQQEGEQLPITSYACQWRPPRRRKQSIMQMSEGTFEKHVYGHERKRSHKSLEDFDPRPPEHRNTAESQLTELLDKVRGKGLCVSLLFDTSYQLSKDSANSGASSANEPLPPELPTKEAPQKKVEEFKQCLKLSELEMRHIEQNTRDQNQSTLWYSVCRYRLTASYFGEVCRRLPTTPPHSLVLRILGAKQFQSAATEWGRRNEELALKQYQQHQHMLGNENLYYSQSGFVICNDCPFLGASPDAVVYDPTCQDPFGLAEVKCPYSCRHMTPIQACAKKDFCSELKEIDGKQHVKLKHNHNYFFQIQGQMAVTGRNWCDFIIYTEKGLSVQRILFDNDLWKTKLLPKLIDFFDNCLAPEILSPIHVLGMPVRDLRNM